MQRDPSHAEGRVVEHLGKGFMVETMAGETVFCNANRRLSAITGDKVVCDPAQQRIVGVLPRTSVLARPLPNGKNKPFAANIDQLIIVFAIRPKYDFLLVDQYLTLCENQALKAQLVLNKSDLLSSDTEACDLQKQIAIYRRLHYPVHVLSTKSGAGIEGLVPCFKERSSLFVGQSGVGKSSLANIFLPDANIRVNTLSKSTARGRHTTTTSRLYRLPHGGNLIDTPGVSIFGLADINEEHLLEGYRELACYRSQCRFRNCKHLDDQGCAIRAAVEDGAISPDRYQRFLKLRDKLLPG